MARPIGPLTPRRYDRAEGRGRRASWIRVRRYCSSTRLLRWRDHHPVRLGYDRDRRAGPRRTDVETLADRSALMRRLPELVAALCRWPDPPGRQICLGTNPGGHCGLEPPDAVAAAAPELAAAAG
jgi:hypothetical protein